MSFDGVITDITEQVWSTALDLEVRPQEWSHRMVDTDRTLAGIVHITGAWDGALALQCSAVLAAKAAGVFFGRPSESLSPTDIQDTLGELANMLGGHFKSTLPAPCLLSLPSVVDGSSFTTRVPGAAPVTQVAFACDGMPFLVTVLQRNGSHV